MRSILTFASVGLAFALTLLLGPEAGLGLGLLIYLAGSNIVLRQQIQALEVHMGKLFDLLPDLLPQRQENAAQPSSPSNDQHTNAPLPEALDQRIQSLEHKLDALLRQLESSASPTAPNASQEPPAQAPSSLSIHPVPPAHMAAPGSSVSISIALQPQPAETHASQAWAELELIQGLLKKIAENLPPPTASSGGNTAPLPPLETAVSSAQPGDDEPTSLRQPSMDDLRAELDKLTRELNIELKRHKQ